MNKKRKKTESPILKKIPKTTLAEVSWEVCNQSGGIYTVIKSKAPVMVNYWGDNYIMIGPYFPNNANKEFDSLELDGSLAANLVQKLRDMNIDAHYGRWLITGRPITILVNPYSVMEKLGDIKYFYHQNHHIDFSVHNPLMDEVLAFGYIVKILLSDMARLELEKNRKVLAHFHEWMGGTAIPDLRKEFIPVKIIFTTHATMLGRYLAMNTEFFYDHLPFLDWEKEAKHFNILALCKLERACAHGAHVFTTVSNVTGKECIHLLSKAPHCILPNGLNIERFSIIHQVQNMHQTYKSAIQRFVMGHFFKYYSFDLDNTLFFFTSGRFEYRNKGFDVILEALARLNWKLKESQSKMNIIMFLVTKQPIHSINPEVLGSRAMMHEIDQNCEEIMKQVKERLFYHAAYEQNDFVLPDLKNMVDDYWKLRYRTTLQVWKSKNNLPSIVTHNLIDDANDAVLHFLRNANLVNNQEDKVKFVYHPDFINTSNPLFGLDYLDFVRGCHLGVFPSYYEPWGYTPVECLASGVATITSDLSGFGDYSENIDIANEEHGYYILKRKDKNFHDAAEELAQLMMRYINHTRRERIAMRNLSEDLSESFDWKNLYRHYHEAYLMALEEIKISKD